jgi:hypothetical protein
MGVIALTAMVVETATVAEYWDWCGVSLFCLFWKDDSLVERLVA